jgi:REP element-mobilizing transposase RayT
MPHISEESNQFYRKSIRLKGYDYRQPGAYFITICTANRKNLFGVIDAGKMILSEFGRVARDEMLRLSESFPQLSINDDEFIIMPNHIHAIFWIIDVGATEPVVPITNRGLNPGSLGVIVGQYKSRVTKAINKLRKTPGQQIWQRNYYDRIIRNREELKSIKNYIIENTLLWEIGQEDFRF